MYNCKMKYLIILFVSSCVYNLSYGQNCDRSLIFTTMDSLREVRLCPADGVSDFVSVSKIDSSSGSTSYSFIIADVQDNLIFVTSDSIFNFEGLDIGICRIWGISHSDSLIFSPGMDVISIRAANGGCAFLSDNVINVIRENPGGGTVQLLNGNQDTSYCATTSLASDTAIAVIGSRLSGLYYTFVLTTGFNVIIENNYSGIFDLSELGVGNYKIFGLSYAGNPVIELPKDSSIFGITNASSFVLNSVPIM